MRSGKALRAFTFEAPMRPLDVTRNKYLDYTTKQSIKFYNKGCEKLPGEPFNGKMLMTWLVQSRQSQYVYLDIYRHHQRKTTHPTLYRTNHGGSDCTCPDIPR
jgi:hypothetical protein